MNSDNEKQKKDILPNIVFPLLSWYAENARSLPWRDEPTPYRVWISEIMLQQTRVEAVRGYFERFISEVPDVAALASLTEEKLFKLWEGLGYYNRARNLKKAAELMVDRYHGELPKTYDELLKLPGIGGYTAGAIASIAYGLPYPAVDGNVLRVLARLLASREDITQTNVKKKAEVALKKIMPADAAGDFTQAMMELGATVCLPNGVPLCASCPLRKLCLGYEKGIQNELPVKKKKASRRIMQRAVMLIICDGCIALRKRERTGMLAGMWELPAIERFCAENEVQKWAETQGVMPISIQKLPDARHIFTHVEWKMQGFRITVNQKGGIFTWVNQKDIREEYAIPSAFKAFVAYFVEMD